MQHSASTAPALPRLPTGTVTLLFTDIEGSTRLAQREPERFPALLEQHRALLRAVLTKGVEFGTEGDAVFAAFPSATDAVVAAARGQRALAEADWPDGSAIRVRMGISTGEVEELAGNYVGLELHRAARICSAAHGGQVLVSSSTAALCRRLPDDLSLQTLGVHMLKDFDEGEELFQVCAGWLQRQFAPPRTARARSVRLPREVGELIGRQEVLGRLQTMVRDERLVTLTGEGGSGKTRLAVRLAWNAAPQFRGSVAFVPLAPLERVDQMAAAVGRALGWQSFQASWSDVLSALAPENALLVLDNAEHLDGVGAMIDELLEGCPRSHVVVTSRRPVHLPGERVFPLDPLDVDSAVDMLVSRVRDRRPSFAPSDPDRKTLREIVNALGCLPLAIELAAARLVALTPEVLLSHLDRQLDILVLRHIETRTERQTTMRSAIRWSYELLASDAQRTLRALSVFATPATMSAVRAVAGEEELAVLEAVTDLLDSSLIRMAERDQPRYWMLEPIRQFAEEMLNDAGETDGARERLFNSYLSVARQFQWQPEQMVRRLQGESLNIVRSVAWAPTSRLDDAVELIFLVDGWLFINSGTSSLREPFVERARAADLDAASRLRLDLMEYTVRAGTADIERARRLVETAKTTGVRELEHWSVDTLAWCLFSHGEYDAAAAVNASRVAQGDLPADRAYFAAALEALIADRTHGYSDEAWATAEARATDADDLVLRVHLLYNQSDRWMVRGDYLRAADLAQQAVDLPFYWDDYPRTRVILDQRLAVARLLSGDLTSAAAHLQDVLLLFDRVTPADHDFPFWVVLVVCCGALIGWDDLDAAEALWHFIAPEVETPRYDIHGIGPVRQEIEKALRDRPAGDGLLPVQDRAQAMDLALDRVAALVRPISG